MLKKFALALIAGLSLTGSAIADDARPQQLPPNMSFFDATPHDIQYYLRHGWSFANDISMTATGHYASPNDEVITVFLRWDGNKNSIIMCKLFGQTSVCYSVFDVNNPNVNVK